MVDLEPVVAAARKYPDSFLAGRFGKASEEALAGCLGLGRPRMQRLLLCRPPRTGAEIAQIAALVAVSPAELAAGLRDCGICAG
jgi:hypothetical protein